MIISRTPFRISFFGGGTDYPVWYREHGGSILGTTIDKYCYITCRCLPPFFEHSHRIVYSRAELVKDINDIQHPSVRETLKFMQITDGMEIHHDGDLPARTGLGSSSSFTVGLLHALYALKGIMPSKEKLTGEAIFIERDVLGEAVGSQDQALTAHGGFRRIDFSADDKINVRPITVDPKRIELLQDHLMLCFTGLSRTASEIAGEQIKQTPNRVKELNEMMGLVDEAIKVLGSDADICDFGRLLHESWQIKRGLTDKISTPVTDELYETALKAGAVGGKVMGAGGGGFMVFFVKPELRNRLKAALKGTLRVPFRFENTGSQIIFYEPDAYYENSN